MNRISLAALVLLIGFAGPAVAQDGTASHRSIGLGFHRVEAPLGLRWWLASQKVGIDAGIGFSSTPAESDPDEDVSGFSLDVGVPIVLASWERAHVAFRPGVLYVSQEVGVGAGPTFDTVTPTVLSILAELEAEIFLVDNISVSAAHGVAFNNFDPDTPGSDSSTSFNTVGSNFSTIGFHMYFLGP